MLLDHNSLITSFASYITAEATLTTEAILTVEAFLAAEAVDLTEKSQYRKTKATSATSSKAHYLISCQGYYVEGFTPQRYKPLNGITL